MTGRTLLAKKGPRRILPINGGNAMKYTSRNISSGLVRAETKARLNPKYRPRKPPAWRPSQRPTRSVACSVMTHPTCQMKRNRR